MILNENYTKEYIQKLHTQSKRDPILLERTIFAFGLLEAITKVNLEAYCYIIKADRLLKNI